MIGAWRKRARMSVEEFLRWESGDDRRYEFVNGQIFAMAPPAEACGADRGSAGLPHRRGVERQGSVPRLRRGRIANSSPRT
jgi:hypothetical protein